jgi:hypothetical protein
MTTDHPKELEKLPDSELQEKLYSLSKEVILNQAVKHQAIIQSMMINQILLLRFSANQERRNSKIQWISIFVAIASLITSAISIFK